MNAETEGSKIYQEVSDLEHVQRLVNKYQLVPGVKRKITFLTANCLIQGYSSGIRSTMGFTYTALGSLERNNDYYSFINQEDIATKCKKFLMRADLATFLKNLEQGYLNIKIEIKKSLIPKKMQRDGLLWLKRFVALYPEYFGVLGVYNVFWRFFQDDCTNKYAQNLLATIGKERNHVAELYPQIEEILPMVCHRVEHSLHLPSNTLSYMSLSEMKHFLATKKIDTESLATIRKRDHGYFHLHDFGSGKEVMCTNEALIENIYHSFFATQNVDHNSEIKGVAAYPGLTQGRVYMRNSGSKPSKNAVLVVNQTHPKDIDLIKRSVAIVADEGGMLCHAAIISRELNKPCIIGTRIATQVLKDGDLVEVDAEKGIVKILKKIII